MEKKQYIKPNIIAFETPPTELLAESFSNGGTADPSGGRAKEADVDWGENYIDEE